MKIFKSLENVHQENDTKPVVNARFSVVEYYYDSFLKKINDCTLSDYKIRENIVNNLEDFCDYDNFQNANTRLVFQEMWRNKRFLTAFKTALPDIRNRINRYYTTDICIVAYDYYAMPDKDEEVANLLLDIVAELLNNIVIPLTSIMDRMSALFIAMSRYSSFQQKICASRVNKYIIKLGYDFSVNNIIYIYSKLYANNFSQLFNVTMTNPVEGLEGGHLTNYNRMNVAILTILDSMSEAEMETVLKNYAAVFELMKDSGKVRFSLHNISEDFARVKRKVEEVSEEWYIP